MKKYQVNLTIDGVRSAIDTITANDDYTAAQYIADCCSNADEEWIMLLVNGIVDLEEI